jgi:molybdate transport system substrate-binding protein
MNSSSLLAAAKIGLMLMLSQGAGAAEVKVLSAAAMRPVMNELGPQFERATGHKLVIQFDVIGALKRKIDAGEPFDVVILTAPVIGDLVNQGKIAGGTRTDIARSGIGVFIRMDARKPDIQSADAFKRAMLDAKSIVYAKDTPVSAYLPVLFDRLGIAEQMKPKIQFADGPGAAAKAVAAGQAELGFGVVSAFEPTPELQLFALLPAELQNYIVYTGGVGTAASNAATGKALIDFLKTPAAAPVLRAKGMDPASP